MIVAARISVHRRESLLFCFTGDLTPKAFANFTGDLTPKALANFSPAVGAKRQPWVRQQE